jgi:hypothetical protein
MFRFISLALCLAAGAHASGYPYMPLDLGPWGIDPSIMNANAVRLADADIKTEEAFFHAVENVEGAIIHAIDDEVEMLFPHHQKSVDE